MRTLLVSVALASGKVTDLRGRLDALKSDHIKMACPLGSLELSATEARLLARDAADDDISNEHVFVSCQKTLVSLSVA